jgi:hypothetical protein
MSPYADLTDRPIKALSEEEVAGLEAGEGMGMALAAELNGYPGPRHVLDMAPVLQLSSEQESRIQAIFDKMHHRAVELGQEILNLEKSLDQSFAGESLSEEMLEEALHALGRARGELRLAHLRAHLETRALLNEAQIAKYRELRGYGG